jgi:hypothetical protein
VVGTTPGPVFLCHFCGLSNQWNLRAFISTLAIFLICVCCLLNPMVKKRNSKPLPHFWML